MRRLRLHLDPDPNQTSIEIDGIPLTGVSGVAIFAEADHDHRVTIEYGCYEVIDITGEANIVHHLCPYGDHT